MSPVATMRVTFGGVTASADRSSLTLANPAGDTPRNDTLSANGHAVESPRPRTMSTPSTAIALIETFTSLSGTNAMIPESIVIAARSSPYVAKLRAGAGSATNAATSARSSAVPATAYCTLPATPPTFAQSASFPESSASNCSRVSASIPAPIAATGTNSRVVTRSPGWPGSKLMSGCLPWTAGTRPASASFAGRAPV